MAEECREQIYSEEYLDYLVEVLPDEIENDTRNLQYCYQLASYRFAVLYERGREYMIGPESHQDNSSLLWAAFVGSCAGKYWGFSCTETVGAESLWAGCLSGICRHRD